MGKAYDCDKQQGARCEIFRFDFIHVKPCIIVIERDHSHKI